jgi:hypothetical protein
MNNYIRLLAIIPALIVFVRREEYEAIALLMIYFQLDLIRIKLGDKNGTTD